MAAEPKLDGWRAVVTVDEGVAVRTRGGHDLELPDLTALADLIERALDLYQGELFRRFGYVPLSEAR